MKDNVRWSCAEIHKCNRLSESGRQRVQATYDLPHTVTDKWERGIPAVQPAVLMVTACGQSLYTTVICAAGRFVQIKPCNCLNVSFCLRDAGSLLKTSVLFIFSSVICKSTNTPYFVFCYDFNPAFTTHVNLCVLKLRVRNMNEISIRCYDCMSSFYVFVKYLYSFFSCLRQFPHFKFVVVKNFQLVLIY